jgi:hypothetical protein
MNKYLALCVLIGASTAYAGEEPLRAAVQTQDAERFAALFLAGKVSAAELQSGYLDGAGRGVQIFTPYRIQNAANLAQQISKRKGDYAHAVATCLPVAESLNAELRAIYLAYRGLLPDLPLPRVYLVFGAGNSGGTAQPDAQVLGLEVLCKEGTTVPEFRATMRRFFAHETVHTWQKPPSGAVRDRLLLSALMEGVPDLLSELVTGLEPDPVREAWARPREAEIWLRFLEDRLTMQSGDEKQSRAAFQRWFANAGQRFENLPEGWPGELGYWVGRNVARAYFAKATDQREALVRLISVRDPAEILQASGYAPR